MITDTTAIVLKTVSFSESSLIVTLLTNQHGKMAAMARGARRNKSKFGGMLQAGAILDVTYYHKSTRDVQNLSDVAQHKPTWRIHQQMEKMVIALVTLELCEQLCHEYEPMPEIVTFLTDFLSWLHETDSNPGHLFPYIQSRLAQLVGIGISWQMGETENDAVVLNSEPEKPFPCYLNVENGSISARSDNGLCFGLTKSQYVYLRYIAEGKKARLLSADFPAMEIKNLIHHLDTYFQFHLEGIKSRRSDAIFEQIL